MSMVSLSPDTASLSLLNSLTIADSVRVIELMRVVCVMACWHTGQHCFFEW
jgi:hypothetical protein